MCHPERPEGAEGSCPWCHPERPAGAEGSRPVALYSQNGVPFWPPKKMIQDISKILFEITYNPFPLTKDQIVHNIQCAMVRVSCYFYHMDS